MVPVKGWGHRCVLRWGCSVPEETDSQLGRGGRVERSGLSAVITVVKGQFGDFR